MIELPNIPQLIGKAIGRLMHIPVDIACGVKEGFTGNGCDEHENVEDVGEPAPYKEEPESNNI